MLNHDPGVSTWPSLIIPQQALRHRPRMQSVTVNVVVVRCLFRDSNRSALKRQGKTRPTTLTSTTCPATLLFRAPATLKALKMLGDRQKDGPRRAFATTNCYGKMAHHRPESPGKPFLSRAVVAIWRSRQMSDIDLLEREPAHGLIERIDAVAAAVVLMNGGSGGACSPTAEQQGDIMVNPRRA
jgi:hypothetical protein